MAHEYYLILKALHLISVICWMAALFYLPRLFVYHAEFGSDPSVGAVLLTMERRLIKIIMTPAMISSFIFGIALLYYGDWSLRDKWLHLKVLLVVGLAAIHGFSIKWHKSFCVGNNCHSIKFFRIINELPPLIMIAIVLLAVLKPF